MMIVGVEGTAASRWKFACVPLQLKVRSTIPEIPRKGTIVKGAVLVFTIFHNGGRTTGWGGYFWEASHTCVVGGAHLVYIYTRPY